MVKEQIYVCMRTRDQGYPLGNPMNWNSGGGNVLSCLTHGHTDRNRKIFRWEQPVDGKQKIRSWCPL